MKKRITALLIKNGIALSSVVIGTGKTYTSSKNRFIFSAGGRKEILNETAKLAVKYFDEQKILLIWSVYGTAKGRTVKRQTFSVKCDSVFNALTQNKTRKIVELTGHGTEDVWIFSIDETENAISKIKELLK
ncbi:MAG: hypothetical protein IJO14_00445 [Clostridia bacterium]|nr:hypothetical protein [Clostridia bacterium]